MIEMAGFDIIAELSIDTLSDLINQSPVTLPDGSQVYLLHGEFTLIVPLTIPGIGDFTVSGFCQASLGGVARTSNCELAFDLTDGAIELPTATIRHVTATVSITAPITFAPDPTPGAPANQVVPTVKNLNATVAVTLDPATLAAMDGLLGPGKGAQVQSSIASELQLWIRISTMPVAAYNFIVNFGEDSHDPQTLSDYPQAFWIDPFTLGIFGYYGAAATGGDVTMKTDIDITQSTQEFIYTNDAWLEVVPARRVAVLMSASGFHQTIACPLITNQVIRQLVFQNYEPEYLSRVQANMGAQIMAQVESAHLSQYFMDELKKTPTDIAGAMGRAQAHIQGDVNQAIANEAASELNAWLNTGDGQAVIAASVPPSCGNGTVEASRQKMPDPFPDAVAMLTELDITLNQGYIGFFAQADGNLPICGSFSVKQSGQVRLPVDSTNYRVVPQFSQAPTDVDISSNILCKGAAATLLGMFTSATWGTALVFIGAAVGESIGEGIIASTIQKRIQSAEAGVGAITPPLPANCHLIDIEIEPVGFKAIALWGRDFGHYNNFSPGLTVTATQLARTQVGQQTEGQMSVAPTSAGCPAGTFTYTKQQYNSSFHVSVSAIDLALPINVTEWQMQIGNFMYTSLGAFINDIKLPGPFWTGSLGEISEPSVTVEGSIWHPEPPLDGLLETENVIVEVTGSVDAGWTLNFSAADGCFYVQISAVATDGDGKIWTASTFLTVTGEVVTFGDDYTKYKADCDQRTWTELLAALSKLTPKVIRGHVAPGAPIEGLGERNNKAGSPVPGVSPQQALTQFVADTIRSRQAGALTTLVKTVGEFGNGVLGGLAKRVGGSKFD